MPSSHTVRRIACLQPSATVILDAIGELDRIVACTKYCADVVPAVADGSRTILSDSWTADAKQIERAVDGDAVQPGAEVGALFEPLQLAVSAQQRLLNHVVGIVLVPSHAISHPKDCVGVTVDQRPEGVRVACPRPAHGCGVGHLHPGH